MSLAHRASKREVASRRPKGRSRQSCWRCRRADPNLYPLGDVGFEAITARFGGVAAALCHRDLHGVDRLRQVGGATEVGLIDASCLADGQGKRWRFVVEFGSAVAWRGGVWS